MRQSGGHIVVESEAGAGAVFKLYFHVAVAAAARPIERASPPHAGCDLNGNETILVVEDDSRLRALDERILNRYGYSVLVAASAEDAVRICAGHRSPIHAAVTDVVMPGGSGRVVGDWVREHKPDTKVIYMSGYTDDAISRRGVLAPGVHFLQKPFSPEALARVLRETLASPTQRTVR